MAALCWSGQPAFAPEKLHGLAFAVWAFAIAVGVCTTNGRRRSCPGSFPGLTVLLATGVLLTTWSVPRVMALLAAVVLELLIDLPDVFSHTLVIGVVGSALLIWWLLVVRRSPAHARDPGIVCASIAPLCLSGLLW